MEEPASVSYRDLLEHALALASSATLTLQFKQEESSPGRRLKSDLAAVVDLEVESVDRWPGTRLHGGQANIWRFTYSAPSAACLLRHSDSLYDWIPPLPEDLALYRPGGSVLMGTISHEADAFLCLTERELSTLKAAVPGLRVSDVPDPIKP